MLAVLRDPSRATQAFERDFNEQMKKVDELHAARDQIKRARLVNGGGA